MSRSTHWRREASGAMQILQHELGRLLEDYLQPSRFAGAERPPTDLNPSAWSPFVDVYETGDEMIVIVEIPGVDQTKVDLAVTGNVLSVRGVKEPGELPEPLLQLREPIRSLLSRAHAPARSGLRTMQAHVDQGVLTIRLPKRSAAKPRTIPIRPG